ncbi:hypothetical protein AGLY_003156 [Aphis glycines]|uniref:Uncharacterized protein n=1 Tax=Aphis glycines TaxID=307491 RepID=A0A6G0U2C0_APHGL|nr:hypothetical protein AGLY_003156 [Aphis glycines]
MELEYGCYGDFIERSKKIILVLSIDCVPHKEDKRPITNFIDSPFSSELPNNFFTSSLKKIPSIVEAKMYTEGDWGYNPPTIQYFLTIFIQIENGRLNIYTKYKLDAAILIISTGNIGRYIGYLLGCCNVIDILNFNSIPNSLLLHVIKRENKGCEGVAPTAQLCLKSDGDALFLKSADYL